VFVVLLAAAGVAYLVLTSGNEEVYVADVDLPAYHQIAQSDVRVKSVDRADVPADAVRERATLVGRYTLTATSQDQPFQVTKLGPLLPEQSLQGPITALPSSSETTMGGQLARGDVVDILLSRNGTADPPLTNRKVSGARVLDIIEGPKAAVIVAITPLSIEDLMAARGSSTVVVVRVQPYAGP